MPVATKTRPDASTVGEIVDNLPAPATATVPATQAYPEATIFQIIARAASDPAVDIDKLERLLAAQERMQAKQSSLEFDNAMAAAQEEMEPIRTNASNPSTRSRYATYAMLDSMIRPIYAKHGFSLSFDTSEGAPVDHVRVVCRLAHRAGHRECPKIDMPCDGKGAKGGDVMTRTHAMGSAVTYGKRYLLSMVFNLATTNDDDGNAAGGYKPAAGSAGGGAEFRPERRATGVPANFVEAARQDGTLDETRTKGTMPGNMPPAKPSAAEKTKKFITDAIQTLKLSQQTVESLGRYTRENNVQLDWIKENFPAEYDRFAIALDDASQAARARVPA